MKSNKLEKTKLLISGILTIIMAISLCIVLVLNLENMQSVNIPSLATGLLYIWLIIFGNIFGFIIAGVLFILGLVQTLLTISKGSLKGACIGIIIASMVFEFLAILSALTTFVIPSGSVAESLGEILTIMLIALIILQIVLLCIRKKDKDIPQPIDTDEMKKNKELALLKANPEAEYAERKRKLDNYLRQGTYDKAKYDEELEKLEINFKTIIDEKSKKD